VSFIEIVLIPFSSTPSRDLFTHLVIFTSPFFSGGRVVSRACNGEVNVTVLEIDQGRLLNIRLIIYFLHKCASEIDSGSSAWTLPLTIKEVLGCREKEFSAKVEMERKNPIY
jgi:hypothetical protein